MQLVIMAVNVGNRYKVFFHPCIVPPSGTGLGWKSLNTKSPGSAVLKRDFVATDLPLNEKPLNLRFGPRHRPDVRWIRLADLNDHDNYKDEYDDDDDDDDDDDLI